MLVIDLEINLLLRFNLTFFGGKNLVKRSSVLPVELTARGLGLSHQTLQIKPRMSNGYGVLVSFEH